MHLFFELSKGKIYLKPFSSDRVLQLNCRTLENTLTTTSQRHSRLLAYKCSLTRWAYRAVRATIKLIIIAYAVRKSCLRPSNNEISIRRKCVLWCCRRCKRIDLRYFKLLLQLLECFFLSFGLLLLPLDATCTSVVSANRCKCAATDDLELLARASATAND